MNESNLNNVPLNFGRYIAVAEYMLYARHDSPESFVPLAIKQPVKFFVDTIAKIHGGHLKKKKYYIDINGDNIGYKDLNDVLASIVDSFPPEGLPAHFSQKDQTIVMLNYTKQKNEIYENDQEENNG